jgi:hypothetical protein
MIIIPNQCLEGNFKYIYIHNVKPVNDTYIANILEFTTYFVHVCVHTCEDFSLHFNTKTHGF